MKRLGKVIEKRRKHLATSWDLEPYKVFHARSKHSKPNASETWKFGCGVYVGCQEE
jgi:hypothetical protein